MSLAVADRSILYDNLSSCGTPSFEPRLQHFPLSCDEVAPLNNMSTGRGCSSPPSPLGTNNREVSPGAPAGDHHRHPSSGGNKKAARIIRNTPRRDGSPRAPPTTRSNPNANSKDTRDQAAVSEIKRGNGRSAPNSAESTQRCKATSAVKLRTSSAGTGEDIATGTSRRRQSPGNNNKFSGYEQRSRSPSSKGRRNSAGKGSAQFPSPSSAKNNLMSRKSTGGGIRATEIELIGQIDGGVKALSSSELTVARRSARDSQRQMRQKAKLAIAMWKERMTKKRDSSAHRLTNSQGCFPSINTNEEHARALSSSRREDESISRSPSPRPSKCRQQIPRHDCQLVTPPGTRNQSPRKKESAVSQRPVTCPQVKSRSNSGTTTAINEVNVVRSTTVSPELKCDSIFVEVQQERPGELIDSPIPRSSPDDLSATDVSTKAASSSQLSALQLQVSGSTKRNSASSRENQRSKIPRPVDGQGEKVKKNDSAETTSILHSSSSSEKGTSQENLLALLPADEKPCEPPPPPPTTPASPSLLGNKSVHSIPSQSNVPEVDEHQRLQQQLRAVVEPTMRDKRRRRGGQRLLHSTDDDEDEWPDSPSTLGSPPFLSARNKLKPRHHQRRSPKTVVSASPPSLLMSKRSSGGDADGELMDDIGMVSPSCVVSGPDSDTQSSAVIMPRRKPFLHRKMMEIKLGGATNDVRDHTIRKRQRQEVYALNQVMTALEFAQFEHFCRARNIPLSV